MISRSFLSDGLVSQRSAGQLLHNNLTKYKKYVNLILKALYRARL